jgi:hypothetical protein
MSQIHDQTKTYAKFYERRRQFMDEVAFAVDLTPAEKVYGLAVAQLADRVSDENADGRPPDSTYKSLPFIADRLGGIDPRAIVKADERLQKTGRIKIVPRGGRQYRTFVLKHDAPLRSIKLGKDFYRSRGKHIEQVMFDHTLTPAQRLIGIALTGLRYGTSLREIAGYLGIRRKTATRAMPALLEAGHFRPEGASGRPKYVGVFWPTEKTEQNQRSASTDASTGLEAVEVGHAMGHAMGHAPPVTPSNISENLPNSENFNNLPYTTYTDPVATRRGHTLSKGSLGRFVALYDLMTGAYAKQDRDGHDTQTVGGIVHISSNYDWVSGEHFTGDEVAEYVRVGWLMRRAKGSKWLYITHAGQDAYEDYYHYDQAVKEAA